MLITYLFNAIGVVLTVVALLVGTHAKETQRHRWWLVPVFIGLAMLSAVISSYSTWKADRDANSDREIARRQSKDLTSRLTSVSDQLAKMSNQAEQQNNALKEIASAARLSSDTSTAEIVKGVTDKLAALLPKPPTARILQAEPVKQENDGMYSQRTLFELSASGPPNNMLVRVIGKGIAGFRVDPVGGGVIAMVGGKDGDVIWQKYQTPPAGRYVILVTGTDAQLRGNVRFDFNVK